MYFDRIFSAIYLILYIYVFLIIQYNKQKSELRH